MDLPGTKWPSINSKRSMPAIYYDRSLDGTTPLGGGGGGATPTQFPFDVVIEGNGTINCTFRIGTLNNIIPSNFDDVFSFSDSVTKYAILSATSTDGEITGCALSFSDTPPDTVPTLMGLPPTAFDILIGLVVDAEWFRTIGTGSPFATPGEAFRTSAASPAPGTLPYDIYYTWVISNA